jgi:hypothetical protein
MDEEIDGPPRIGERLEHRLDASLVGHVARQNELRADLGGKGLDALFDSVALISERDLSALVAAGLGDAPGDGAVVGDAEHDAALARHQFGSFRH